MIEIYTDGACSGNPGPGGFGVVVFDGEKYFTIIANNHKIPLIIEKK